MSAAAAEPKAARKLALDARRASKAIAQAPTAAKRDALRALASGLRNQCDSIIAANDADMKAGKEAGLSSALLDRLRLDRARIEGLVGGVEEIAALDDPVGEISGMRRVPSGLSVGRMRIPLGVVLMIYESRPGVTVDAGALCLMSGNAAILRGGSIARNSNRAFGDCFVRALGDAGLVPESIQVAHEMPHEGVGELLAMDDMIDVAIPRGGKDLIEAVCRQSAIPVLKHSDGNCHIYVDKCADTDEACAIVDNAKTQRPGVCNAVETLLVHQETAKELLPEVAAALLAKNVELRGCPRTAEVIGGQCRPTAESDWDEEYLDLVLAIKVVDSLDEAIGHINRHSSQHTEAIVTRSHDNAWRFLREVDSSSVIVNASTRFADGGVYGLGAEIGISTGRLHARGPVGLRELTTEKFVVLGNGQVRE